MSPTLRELFPNLKMDDRLVRSDGHQGYVVEIEYDQEGRRQQISFSPPIINIQTFHGWQSIQVVNRRQVTNGSTRFGDLEFEHFPAKQKA